jgi:hypothetical protein
MQDGLPACLLLYGVHGIGLVPQASLWVNPTYIEKIRTVSQITELWKGDQSRN